MTFGEVVILFFSEAFLVYSWWKSRNLYQHFLIALLLGFIFRSCASYFVFGPQALDDYLNQLMSAFRLMRGLPHDLPAYRSPLVTWLMLDWMRLGQLFSIQAVVDLIRWTYFGLGLCSLLAVYGAYKYFEVSPRDHDKGVLAVYLVALHGLMPFVSTRAFLESFSLCFIAVSFGFFRSHQVRPQFLNLAIAFLALGFATLIRFQVGILYVYALIFFAFKKEWRNIAVGVLIGLFFLLCQSLIEVIDQRPAFSILRAYFKANENVSNYGVSPWHSTWVTWLAIFYFPFSFFFFQKVKVLREHLFLILGLLLFVLIHSLVPHKEERFLYPIFGATLFIMAILWSETWYTKTNRFFFKPFFILLNSLLLLISCFSNTQLGEIGVPAALQKKSDRLLYLSHSSMVDEGYMYELFITAPSQLHKIDGPPDFAAWDRFALEIQGLQGVAVMTSNAPYLEALQKMAGQNWHGLQCGEVEVMNSLTDGWLYKMSPERNYRRRPTWYLSCIKRSSIGSPSNR